MKPLMKPLTQLVSQVQKPRHFCTFDMCECAYCLQRLCLTNAFSEGLIVALSGLFSFYMFTWLSNTVEFIDVNKALM